MTGIKRNLKHKINRLLEFFPVVMLIGARQTGKNTLSKMLRPDWKYIDLENASDFDFLSRDYGFFSASTPNISLLTRCRRTCQNKQVKR